MLACAALALVALTDVAAAAPQASLPPDPRVPKDIALEDPPIFPLKDIKAGLHGKGYTVFESDKGPEAFDVDILGVMHGYLGPGEDLIIAKLSGKQIERTGVIAGMSGSPVYIDGKLVGAVGYRFGQFTKDPIAGITPIERMLTAATPTQKRSPASSQIARGTSSSASPSSPSSPASPWATLPQTAWGQGEPIATPIAVSGLSPSVLAAFGPELEKRGYQVFAAGGASGSSALDDSEKKGVRFYAGGPIAGNLIEGDINMGAIGTVTWVKGDRFLAFGHPFLGTGETAMPVANADIITTVASDAGSWKMGQPTVPVGRLSDDRLHAIAGTMGEHPPMVPLVVKMEMESPRRGADAKAELRYSVFQHETDTPLFVAIAVANTLANRVAAEKSGGTVDVTINATLTTGDTVPYSFRAADEGQGFDMPVAFGLLGLLTAAIDQDFVKAKLSAVDVSIKARHSVDKARIVSVDATKALVPGQASEVRVRMQSWQGPIVEKLVPIRVPAGVPAGQYQLVAAGQMEAARVEKEGGLVPIATTYKSYLDSLEHQPPPGSLNVYLVADEPTLRIEGKPLPDLPASYAGLLSDGGGLSGGTVETKAARLSRTLEEGVVAGESTAKVRVHDVEQD